MKAVRIALLLVLVLSLLSCAGVPDQPANTGATGPDTGSKGTYKIGVDDGLQITVWRNPDLSATVPVRPDGKISVPLVGDVQAGGLTPEDVAATIKQKLAYYIRDPNVTVIVANLRSHEFLTRVRVTGAVRTPASLPYHAGMTVLDAVLEAGGVSDFAAPNRTKLYRKDKSKTDVFDIDLGDILYKGKLDTNYEVKAGDIITVPERLF